MKLLKLIKPTRRSKDKAEEARAFENLAKKTSKTSNYIGDVGKKTDKMD